MNLKASQVTSRIEGKFSAPVPGCADCGLSEHELPQLGGEAAPLAAAPHEAAVAGGAAVTDGAAVVDGAAVADKAMQRLKYCWRLQSL